MPGDLTEITEIATALGTLWPRPGATLTQRPEQLVNVPDEVWDRLVCSYNAGLHAASFSTAFDNGRAFLAAAQGLRGRAPLRAEWKGPQRAPGDDVIPADLRIDFVFLVSCKYLSKLLLNAGPPRLFDRLLVGDDRSRINWFAETAPAEFRALYASAKSFTGLLDLPAEVHSLTREQQRMLRSALSARAWPPTLQAPWARLCGAVASESALRWRQALVVPRDRLRLLLKLLRITTATYFVLGADRTAHLRIRVDSAWDWMQAYELRAFEVAHRTAGQPEVAWRAAIRRRSDGRELAVDGHVEIRWGHGRFVGPPESKVYLDTPHTEVPGYNPLT